MQDECNQDRGMANCQAGAYGWLHDNWNGSFYPDDLPNEWRLQYYSNELNFVMVPATYWQKGNGYESDGWLDDTADEFRFCLEIPRSILLKDSEFSLFMKQVKKLSSRLMGLCLPVDTYSDEMIKNIVKLSQLNSIFTNTHFDDIVEEPIWVKNSQRGGVNKEVYLAIFEDDLRQLRQTRESVESFADKSSLQPQFIVVKNDHLQMNDLIRFRSMLEIMGL